MKKNYRHGVLDMFYFVVVVDVVDVVVVFLISLKRLHFTLLISINILLFDFDAHFNVYS